MKKYLLDTNICVFLLRGKYNVDKAIDRVGIAKSQVRFAYSFVMFWSSSYF